jgi:hypothetical protein
MNGMANALAAPNLRNDLREKRFGFFMVMWVEVGQETKRKASLFSGARKKNGGFFARINRAAAKASSAHGSGRTRPGCGDCTAENWPSAPSMAREI